MTASGCSDGSDGGSGDLQHGLAQTLAELSHSLTDVHERASRTVEVRKAALDQLQGLSVLIEAIERTELERVATLQALQDGPVARAVELCPALLSRLAQSESRARREADRAASAEINAAVSEQETTEALASIARLEARLQEQVAQVEALRTTVAQLERDREDAHQALDTACSRSQGLEHELRELELQRERVDMALDALSNDHGETLAALDAAREQLVSSQAADQARVLELEQLHGEADGLREQLGALQAADQARVLELEQLHREADGLREQLGALQAADQARVHELEQLHGEADGLREQLGALQAADQARVLELEQLHGEADERQERVSGLENRLAAVASELTRALEELGRRIDEAREHERAATELDGLYQQLRCEHDAKLALLEQLTSERDALLEGRSALEEQSRSVYDDLAAARGQASELRAESAALEKQCARLGDELQAMQSHVQGLLSSQSELAAERDQAQTQHAQLAVDNLSLAERLQQLEAQVRDMESAAADAQAERDAARADLQQAHQQLEPSAHALHELQAQLETSGGRIERLEAELSATRVARDEFEADFALVTLDLNQAQSERDDHRAAIDGLREHNERLSSELEHMLALLGDAGNAREERDLAIEESNRLQAELKLREQQAACEIERLIKLLDSQGVPSEGSRPSKPPQRDKAESVRPAPKRNVTAGSYFMTAEELEDPPPRAGRGWSDRPK